MVEWKARFKNKKYDIDCIVQTNKDCADSFSFKLIIDDLIFISSELTDWELKEDELESNSKYKNFDLFKSKYLQKFTLSIFIDMLVFNTEVKEQINACLNVTYTFGVTDDTGCNYAKLEDSEFLLSIGEETFKSSVLSEYFDEALVPICKSLGNKYQLINCFGCAYSDYSPYGGGNIGNLYCFYNIKEKYLTVCSKYATPENNYTVFDAFEERLHFPVQEVDLCENFRPRLNTKGGYRGQIYNQ